MNDIPIDKKKAIQIAKEYKALVAEWLPLKALYLYGSYSKGNHMEDSDIDIAVVVERVSDDYFEDTPLLWKLKRKISNLIEPVLLMEDTNNPLYADILKTGILI
ncbi:nucleotidyltransferase domain-containing protein [Barnesiella viscericola]|uniref:nucleotidyltransferase domain-containing protein n=1 Tax=Barnesiella viscericola TaxID=397865 RepID=UPI002357ADBB|nr:nucleotidyltransferase domain-containing protein [Barnesiella viscericola]